MEKRFEGCGWDRVCFVFCLVFGVEESVEAPGASEAKARVCQNWLR